MDSYKNADCMLGKMQNEQFQKVWKQLGNVPKYSLAIIHSWSGGIIHTETMK